MRAHTLILAAAMAGGLCRIAAAGEADVLAVWIQPVGDSRYSFSVTVRHADAGWKHYADRWQVLAPDGTILGERVLEHPHDDEQPFTRGLSGVAVPEGITEVTVRAGDLVHGFSGVEMTVRLPTADG